MKTYLDKATKDASLQPLQTEYLYVSNNALPDTTAANFTTYFSTGNIKSNAETYLLTLDKYKDSTIVE